jgi:hypothetical protein
MFFLDLLLSRSFSTSPKLPLKPHCKMRNHAIAVATLQLLGLGAAQGHQVFKNTPRAHSAVDNVYRRQSPPPGYHPEFGACGSGTTCENACGPNWMSCEASTDLSLFCYNAVDLKQTCCENGSGRGSTPLKRLADYAADMPNRRL